MLNTAFDAKGARAGDYYPPELRSQIDELTSWIYETVNNGVYKAEFATTQQSYDEAVTNVFQSLARLEQILDRHRISDYPNLYGFLREIYQIQGVAETVDLVRIRSHYYRSYKTINPTGINSIGPAQDLDASHRRDLRFNRG